MLQIWQTPWQNGCLCQVPDHTLIANQIHKRSKLGLVERNEYMWHSDCPKESYEILFLS